MTTHFNIYHSIFLTPLQEAFSSRQHSNSADRAVLLSLATEKGDIGSIIHTVKSNIKALEGKLKYFICRTNCSSLPSFLPPLFVFFPPFLFASILYSFLYLFSPILHFIQDLSIQIVDQNAVVYVVINHFISPMLSVLMIQYQRGVIYHE